MGKLFLSQNFINNIFQWAKVKQMKDNNEEMDPEHPLLRDLKKAYDEENAELDEAHRKYQEKNPLKVPFQEGSKKYEAIYDAQVRDAESVFEQQKNIEIPHRDGESALKALKIGKKKGYRVPVK